MDASPDPRTTGATTMNLFRVATITPVAADEFDASYRMTIALGGVEQANVARADVIEDRGSYLLGFDWGADPEWIDVSGPDINTVRSAIERHLNG